jgi:hypothetical protein
VTDAGHRGARRDHRACVAVHRHHAWVLAGPAADVGIGRVQAERAVGPADPAVHRP